MKSDKKLHCRIAGAFYQAGYNGLQAENSGYTAASRQQFSRMSESLYRKLFGTGHRQPRMSRLTGL
ncbi:MAG: hypothetical protein R3B47_21280 [Bacteroidia bacterium]